MSCLYPDKILVVSYFGTNPPVSSFLPGLKSRNDLAKVVADHAEPHIFGVFLHDPSQGILNKLLLDHSIPSLKFFHLIIAIKKLTLTFEMHGVRILSLACLFCHPMESKITCQLLSM